MIICDLLLVSLKKWLSLGVFVATYWGGFFKSHRFGLPKFNSVQVSHQCSLQKQAFKCLPPGGLWTILGLLWRFVTRPFNATEIFYHRLPSRRMFSWSSKVRNLPYVLDNWIVQSSVLPQGTSSNSPSQSLWGRGGWIPMVRCKPAGHSPLPRRKSRTNMGRP